MDDASFYRRGGRQIRERYRFINDMLAWTGTVRSADLREEFAISPQQAANDLRGFAQETLGVTYDEGRKCWIRDRTFDPSAAGDLDEFLGRHPSMRHRLGFEELILPWQSSSSRKSWLGKFGRRDKWSFCLTAVRMAAEQEKR